MTNCVPCPKCRSAGAERITFTWWGGLLGSRLINHVRCPACRYAYNGKTGKDNTAAIVVYLIVVGGSLFFLLFVIGVVLGGLS